MHPLIKPLTASILILALLSAGCTDTGGSSANNPAAVETVTQPATSMPILAPTETPWYIDKPGFGDAVVTDVKTIDGSTIHGVMNGDSGSYNLYDIDTGERILNYREYPNFDLYSELQPEQARALEDEYGYPITVMMEQADTDGDGALDTVAVRYEGSKGVGEFTMDYGKPTSKSVGGVLSEMIVAKLQI